MPDYDPDFAGGWRELKVRTPPVRVDIHVVPVNDLRDHELKPTCWCKPHEDQEMLCEQSPIFGYMHNALDQRELIENGVRLKS